MSNVIARGIDISEFNTVKDWNKVKAAGYDFVILRAGFGMYESQVDKRFFEYAKAAAAAGLKLGAYWYSYAASMNDAVKEAELFIQTIEKTGIVFEYPLYMDVEDKSLTTNKAALTNIVEAFCEQVESSGYYAGVYCNLSFYTNRIDFSVLDYDIWIADWEGVDNCANPHGMRQYSDKGTVDGITGFVDLDIAYYDFPAVISAAGLNNPTNKETLADIVKNFVESVKNYL